jgi:shikimate 5-dehydrogenase
MLCSHNHITVKKAEILASEIGCNCGSLEDASSATFDMVINTTSVGMYPQPDGIPIRKECLQDVLVFDMVYNPLKTRLIHEAEASGCSTVMGIEMFVNQAAEQFTLWTDREAPRDLMKKVVSEELS